jgi:hypothetical protein
MIPTLEDGGDRDDPATLRHPPATLSKYASWREEQLGDGI